MTSVDSAFTITASGRAFKVLSDGLYSDKISAVIRELSCNAYDSHVAANKVDVPFEIHLPSDNEPWFSVQDYGLGISDADIHSIYTRYFTSTKVGNSNQIGELGLGSKSPFSLVREFEVTSIHNGTCSRYRMYFDDSDTPRVQLVEQKPTTDGNGLQVKFTVPNYHDRLEFESKAINVLRWFKTTPIVKLEQAIVEIENLTVNINSNGWGLQPNVSRYAMPYALMGNVAYLLEKSSIKGNDDHAFSVLRLPLIVRFDIGELEVAASREGLGYDDRTCNNLKTRLIAVYNDIHQQYADKISSADTEWDARSIWNQYLGENVDFRWELHEIFSNRVFKWRGVEIKNKYKIIDLTKFYSAASINKNNTVRWIHRGDIAMHRVRQNDFKKHSVSCTNDVKIVFDDLPRNGAKRVKHWLSNCKENIKVYLYSQPDVYSKPADGWPALYQDLGCPEIIWTSELEAPPVTKRNRKPVKMLKFGTDVWRHVWQEVDIDLSKGGFYIDKDRNDPIIEDGFKVSLSSVVSKAKELGLLTEFPDIYSSNKSTLKKISKMKNWVNIISYLREKFSELISSEDYWADHIATSELLNNIRSSMPVRDFFLYRWDLRDENSAMKKLLTIYHEWSSKINTGQMEKNC